MLPLDPLTIPLTGMRLIEASAGTGKTHTIATLYLRLLLERDLSVRQILVVTFTKAATEELRDRIRQRLRETLAALRSGQSDDPQLSALLARVEDRTAAARRLQDEITCLDEAAIFTIHGFCQRMLQENAFESALPFELEFISDEAELLAEVVRDFWRRSFHQAGAGLAALVTATWGNPDGLGAEIRPWLGKADLTLQPEVAAEQCDAAAWLAQRSHIATLWERDGAAITQLVAEHPALSRAQDKGYPAARWDEACAALEGWLGEPPDPYQLPPLFELFTSDSLAQAISAAKAKKGAQPPQHELFERCQQLWEMRSAKQVLLTCEAITWCRAELSHRKRDRGLLAFDDLLLDLHTALLAPGGEVLAARIAGLFPAALIDEFQDTDLAQFRIFDTLYRPRPDCALYLIGDPKQAIYSFRGADIFTYMEAKRTTAPTARYTLATNWRSTADLVTAVNALFERCQIPFLYAGAIDFQAVAAAGQADESPLTIDGRREPPLVAWFLERGEERVISKKSARAQLAQATAVEVARLLALGRAGRACIGAQPLQPRDIAVLVRNHREAAQIQEALRRQGVASVYYSRESVFSGAEAEALLRLLTAIATPSNEGLLRATLCDGLIGLSGAELEALIRDEPAWEQRVLQFHDYLAQWQQRGFMAMFRRLLHEQQIPARLLSQTDGERRLTDLLQLAELLQAASRDHPDGRLIRWLTEQRQHADGNSEEQQLRLESDEARVKIVTIHRSKGLEYPIVLLPFLWATQVKNSGPLLYHADDSPSGSVLHLLPAAEQRQLAQRERLAEEVRLVYVALTRARHRCYFAWGAIREAEHSGLAWLLHAAATEEVEGLATRLSGLTDEALRAPLAAVAAAHPTSCAVTAPPADAPPLPPLSVTAHPLAARTPLRPVRWQWRLSSYSGLTQGRFEGAERPDHGSGSEDRSGAAGQVAQRFLFPKGARAGVLLHQLLERIDFTGQQGPDLASETQRQLARHGLAAEWSDPLCHWLGEVLATPLTADGLKLAAIPRQRRLDELEFHYPMAAITPAELEAVLADLGTFQPEDQRLAFQPAAGLMRGFIDLVFEHAGRFYVVDYKSSWLGAQFDAYTPDHLAQTVAHHRYDLQYLLYSLALHRYLSVRLPGYHYERHFGGVFYLFLRGMEPSRGASSGVYYDRPAAHLIAQLDALMWGEAA